MTYQPKGLGLQIFNERYRLHNEETWTQACQRVASTVAMAEDGNSRLPWGDLFYIGMAEGLFMPGGRTWYGSGRPLSQLLNCFVIPAGDSREAWGKSLSDMLVTSGMGGGVGTNFSSVRPRGYPIHRMGGEATGSVSLMRMFNSVGDELVGGGNRRLALMECLNIDHPDVKEFVDAKLDKGELNNANVSVIIPDDLPTERLIEMIRNNEELPLRFNRKPDILERKEPIYAGDLFKRILENSINSGEPGILNAYLANKENNVSYVHPLISTNPCGEIWLPAYGCCDLGALVLPNFVANGRFDWHKFDMAVGLGVRFLDNVLDVSNYPLPEIKEMAQNERRIGLGVMGLHSMLLDLGYSYSSDESLQFIDTLFRRYRDTAYTASVELAKEKGPFALYDERFLDSPFVRRLPKRIKDAIREHGIRNCALLTIAPTGTTSMVHGVTGGIEPLFAPVYLRRRRIAGPVAGTTELVETLVVHKDYLDHKELAEGQFDISVKGHFDVQRTIQPYIDNAVSKTINLAARVKLEDVYEEVLDAMAECKGLTFYQEGSRMDEPLKAVRREDLDDLLKTWEGEIDYEGLDTNECPTGVCLI